MFKCDLCNNQEHIEYGYVNSLKKLISPMLHIHRANLCSDVPCVAEFIGGLVG